MIALLGIKNILSKSFAHKELICSQCGENEAMIIEIYQRHAHLFFIPLFPAGKEVRAICSKCHYVNSEKEFTPDYKEAANKDRKLTKTPLWTFIGIPLLLGIFWYSKHKKKPNPVDAQKISACLKQLAPDQVYEVSIGAPNRISFPIKKMVKVIEVEGEAVVILHGTEERFANEELMNVAEGSRFTETPLTITRKEFEKMPFIDCK